MTMVTTRTVERVGGLPAAYIRLRDAAFARIVVSNRLADASTQAELDEMRAELRAIDERIERALAELEGGR